MGLDMMTRTCTVQVNLDFSSEDDMRRKLRVSLALQPVATALFANSPFTEGRPNGFLSYRAHVWTDTDNDRVRHPIRAVRAGSSASNDMRRGWSTTCRCISFIEMDVTSTSPAGRSGDLWKVACRNWPGETATIGDFADHMTTAFTDVRLKRFLEMRGADAGRPDMMLAQSAFWVGLLYDDDALAAAVSLVSGQSWADTVALRDAVPRLGLDTPYGARTLRRSCGRSGGDCSAPGFDRAIGKDSAGLDETGYLDSTAARLSRGGPTQAEWWLECYRGAWNGRCQPDL